MSVFLITFAVMVLAVLGMSIGVITGRRELKGSCGGLNNGGDCPCARQDACEKSEAPQGSATKLTL